MKNQRLVCIDFGSAYTKVAVRSDWDETAKLLNKSPVASSDYEYCIPSVVARVERKDGTRWLIGQDAAARKSGENVTVYRHWKAGLFSGDTKGLGPSGRHSAKEYHEVGVRFFTALRNSLGDGHAADYPVRVCIPKLPHGDVGIRKVREIIAESGWALADDGATVYEPESNLCGVFTRGRNSTWMPPTYRTRRFPYYLKMFDKDGVLGAARQALRRTSGFQYKALVTDLGAFTTDFGFIQLDDSFFDRTDVRPDIEQESVELGVRELDLLIYEQLSAAYKSAIRAISTTEWETAKYRLYAGSSAAIPNPEGGVLHIGSTTEQESLIRDSIEAFATRVLKAQRKFCEQHVKGKVHAHVLTGGGFMIPLVRNVLVRAVKEASGSKVYDLLDENEPRQTLLPKRRADGWHHDEREVEARLRESRELVRGGSAMGGSSVYFERSEAV